MPFFQLPQGVLARLDVAPCVRFRHAVYDMAMGLERFGTGLMPKTVSVDGMEIAVLEGRGRGERAYAALGTGRESPDHKKH